MVSIGPALGSQLAVEAGDVKGSAGNIRTDSLSLNLALDNETG